MVASPASQLSKPYTIYRLNTARGVTNIGSHPDNDIVIQDPAVMPFHLMLDHRQKPIQVYILSPDADVCINGVRLAGSDSKEIYSLSQLQFAGYTLREQEGENGSVSDQVAVIPLDSLAPTAPIPTFGTLPPRSNGKSEPVAAFAAQARLEDVILVSLAEPPAAVNVDQTAVYTMTVVNGGPIVASFDLEVEGVPREWVQISPARLNLYEGGRAPAEVRITAPRDPSSLASTYPLQFVATSPNYPGLRGTAQGAFILNPYDEYTVGNLNPRSKAIAWGKKSSQASFPLTNFGNHPAGFRVSALDEENGCQFSFPQPGQADLVRQAEVQVGPGQTVNVPVVVSPIRRSLIRLQPKQYPFTVTTQSLDDPTSLRTISGTLTSRPLLGLFSLLLIALVLAVGIYFLFRPRIYSFDVKSTIIRLGESAVLQWRVSPVTTNLQITGITDPIKADQNQVTTIPTTTATTYTLTAGNWLSSLLRMELHSQPVTVLAVPSYPEIDTFLTDSETVFQGDNLTATWATKNATEVYLTVGGVTEALKPDQFSGQRVLPIKTDTLLTVRATNNSGTVERSLYVQSVVPSVKLVSFDVSPQTVTKGDPVTISWEVTGNGIQSVMISPFTDPLPNSGKLTFFPDTSMEFVLTVKSRGDQQLQPELRSVGVLAAAAAPKINIFNVIPNKLTIAGNVEVSWSVTGATTNIVLTSLDGQIASGLPAQGFRSVPISKTTSLILTAYNGTLSDAQSKDVELSTLKPVQVLVTAVTPNTKLLLGDTVLVQFSVKPLDSKGNPATAASLGYPEVSGTVDVTDGFDNCNPVPALPATSCQMTITRITNQPIYATYSGDANYARTTSGPFSNYAVSGNPALMTASFTYGALHGANLVTGEPFLINFTFAPLSAAATYPVKGTVDVYDVTGGGNVALPTCQSINLSPGTDKNNPLNGSGSCPMSGFTTVGQKSLKFVFRDSDYYASSPPVDNSLYVVKADTVVTYQMGISTATVTGQSFPVTVAVKAKAPGGGVPTGQVDIFDTAHKNAENSCQAAVTLASQGNGTCDLTLWHASATTKTIEASYSGDANYNASLVDDTTHMVNPAPTVLSMSFSPGSGAANAQVGQTLTVTFSLAATGGGAGTPTGQISLSMDGNSVANCGQTNPITYPTTSQCSLTLPSYKVLTLQATYAGSSDYQGSISSLASYQVLPAETEISFVDNTPDPPAVAATNTSVDFHVHVATKVTSSVVPTGTITIQGNSSGSTPGETNNGTCTYTSTSTYVDCSITLTIMGPRTITISYNPGTADFQPSSKTINYTILRGVNLNLFTYQTSPIVGQQVTMNFSVTPADGLGGIPTGTVTVTATNTTNAADVLSCTGNVSAGYCSIQFAKAATYNAVAFYTGDSVFAQIDSATKTLSISPATTQIPDISLSRTNIQIGDLFNVTFQVLNIDSSPIPSGYGYVRLANTSYCGSPVSNGDLNSWNQVGINALGIGSYMNLSFNTSGTWIVNVFFRDPNGNFSDACFAKQVYP